MCPNWSPSNDHIDILKRIVNYLTNQRCLVMEADYPLTEAQVIAITTPPRLKEFIALGYDSLQKTHSISYELGPEQGLSRRSITSVRLTEPVYYAFERQKNTNYRENMPIFFDNTVLDGETMEKLKKWTELAVYERRLAALVCDTVAIFFRHRGNEPLSMYHIMARWPALKVVFPHVSQHAYGRSSEMWERHSNEVGRDLHRWSWPMWGEESIWREKHRKRMTLTEETLLSCVSLPKPKEIGYSGYGYGPGYGFRATLSDWQKFGDQPL